MCCESTETLGLPPEVIEALARYRRLLAERGADWGDEQVEFSRWARCSLVGPVFEAFLATGDWGQAIRTVIGRVVPAGVVVVRVDAGRRLRAEVGPARVGIAGRSVRLDVVIESAADAELALTVAGQEVRVAARGVTVETIARWSPTGRGSRWRRTARDPVPCWTWPPATGWSCGPGSRVRVRSG